MEWADRPPGSRPLSRDSPTPFFLGPKADLLLFGASALLLPAMAIACRVGLPVAWVAQFYLYILLYPHLLACFHEAFSGDDWRRRPWLYVVLPALLCAAMVIAWITDNIALVLQVRFYSGVIHVGQHQARLLAYDRRRNGVDDPIRDWAEHISLIVGQVVAFQLLLRHLGENPILRRVDLPMALLVALGALAGLATLVAAGYLVRDALEGRSSRFAAITWLAVALSFVFFATFFKGPLGILVYGFYFGYVGWHCVQYICWTHYSYRRRDEQRGTTRKWGRRLVAYWLVLIVVSVPIQLAAQRVSAQGLVITLLALTHIYFDLFHWRWESASPRSKRRRAVQDRRAIPHDPDVLERASPNAHQVSRRR